MFQSKQKLDWSCVEGAFGGGLLCKPLSEAFAVVLDNGSLHATVLGMGAACLQGLCVLVHAGVGVVCVCGVWCVVWCVVSVDGVVQTRR